MAKSICVFCASSDHLDPAYIKAAEDLGRLIGQKGYTLVYGGGNNGLMGVLAKAVHHHGGKIVGVIPSIFHSKGFCYEKADEVILTKDLHERKTVMEEKSDGFIALSGGYGTLDELAEVIALKQLRFHSKPIVIVNTKNFYDPLLRFFEQMIEQNFAKEKSRDYFCAVTDVQKAFEVAEKL